MLELQVFFEISLLSVSFASYSVVQGGFARDMVCNSSVSSFGWRTCNAWGDLMSRGVLVTERGFLHLC